MAFFEIKFKDKTRFEKTLDKLRDLTKDWMDEPTANKLAKACIAEMKNLISSGISPIRGGAVNGKFPKYLDKDKYPGKFKDSTPVNLKLSGDFLSNLTFRVEEKGRNGKKAIIGFFDSESQDKEAGHRAGSDKKKTKRRPIIPVGREKLAVKVENTLISILKDRLKELGGK